MSEYDILINKYDALNAGYDQLYPKPMKHANTHASGGTDPITPGDIGAYSKNETDTLLQNNNPRQWGLGLNGPPATDDCDTATKNGWYHVYGATLNKPFGKVGALLVVCRESTQMYQLFFVGETYSTGGSCIIVRSMYGGTWGPWEWVNPPMEVGVEYRTTERYQGKPVYTVRVDVGSAPKGLQMLSTVGFPQYTGIEKVIRLNARNGNSSLPSAFGGTNSVLWGPEGFQAFPDSDDNRLYVRVGSTGTTNTVVVFDNIQVTVFYTKIAD